MLSSMPVLASAQFSPDILRPDDNYTETLGFSEDLAAVDKDGKQGIIENTLTCDETIKVSLNGDYLVFDQQPIIVNGQVLVPMRAIFEAMGAEVKWDDSTQTVYATHKTDTLVEVYSVIIDDTMMIISWYDPVDSSTLPGRKYVTLDVAPILVGDRTLVPTEAIVEAFFAKVEWDEITKTVIIITK